MTTLVANNTKVGLRPQQNIAAWYVNTNIIGIDNRYSGCISHKSEDFIGDLKDCQRQIKEFGGTRHYNVKIGTLKWHWEDDNSKIHKFVIPNSYYIPEGRVRLLSPQHWAQTQKDFKPISGTKEITDHQTTVLYWKQMKFQKTVPLSSQNNVATSIWPQASENLKHMN